MYLQKQGLTWAILFNLTMTSCLKKSTDDGDHLARCVYVCVCVRARARLQRAEARPGSLSD